MERLARMVAGAPGTARRRSLRVALSAGALSVVMAGTASAATLAGAASAHPVPALPITAAGAVPTWAGGPLPLPDTGAPIPDSPPEPVADTAPSWVAGLYFGHGMVQGFTVGDQLRQRGPTVATETSAVAFSDAVLAGHALVGASAKGAVGIPAVVLDAYRRAAAEVAASDPRCGLPWWLLAGIGRIESGHASDGRVNAAGTTRGRILGPRLDGSTPGTAVIADSDGGALDGDPHFDRAVGPMQFLPGTWRGVASDGNGDGIKDPNNVYDAALGAARYLCTGGANLRTSQGLASAVLRYNNSMSYVQSVLGWGMAYRDGVAVAPSAPGRVPRSDPRQSVDVPELPGVPAVPRPPAVEEGGGSGGGGGSVVAGGGTPGSGHSAAPGRSTPGSSSPDGTRPSANPTSTAPGSTPSPGTTAPDGTPTGGPSGSPSPTPTSTAPSAPSTTSPSPTTPTPSSTATPPPSSATTPPPPPPPPPEGGSITGTVWTDANADGIREQGETFGLPPVTVALLQEDGTTPVLDANGQPVVTTTDPAGNYTFSITGNGSYVVQFTNLPDQAVFTQPGVGTDPNLDSDALPPFGATAPQMVHDGLTVELDAGVLPIAAGGTDSPSPSSPPPSGPSASPSVSPSTGTGSGTPSPSSSAADQSTATAQAVAGATAGAVIDVTAFDSRGRAVTGPDGQVLTWGATTGSDGGYRLTLPPADHYRLVVTPPTGTTVTSCGPALPCTPGADGRVTLLLTPQQLDTQLHLTLGSAPTPVPSPIPTAPATP